MNDGRLAPRVAALVRAFERVARERMAGLAFLNPALDVEAVGFRACPAGAPLAFGVLVSPWFMNLVALPLERRDTCPRTGEGAVHRVGATPFDFLACHEPAVGRFEACSLFSPMADFADMAAARATARAVLEVLYPPGSAQREPAPARRGFLFGRPAVPREAA